MFVNSVTKIASDVNCFDKTKYRCAVCDQKGNTFDTCPELKNFNIPQLYLEFLFLKKGFVCGRFCLDPAGIKPKNDLNVVCEVF